LKDDEYKMIKTTRLNETLIVPVFINLSEGADFERVLSQAINEGLTSISTIVAPVLRTYLDDAVVSEVGRMKSRSSIKDLKALENGLEKMFGFGAKVFERKILESLCTKLSIDMEMREDLCFSETIEKMKRIYESRIEKKTGKKVRQTHRKLKRRQG
jgi:hypothetical protein